MIIFFFFTCIALYTFSGEFCSGQHIFSGEFCGSKHTFSGEFFLPTHFFGRVCGFGVLRNVFNFKFNQCFTYGKMLYFCAC